MKNTTILALIGIIVVVAGIFMFANNNSMIGQVTAVDNPVVLEGQTQKVTISERDLNYYPSQIKVKANQPVEITLDNKVSGCLRAFTIKDLGVSKYAPTPNDKILFTPTKKGTFTFTCSMGMGFGKIIVE